MDRKAAFQKVICQIRKDWRVKQNTPRGEYPKAMMTAQQEAKNTATVNCGGEWCSFSRELAEYVLNDERFLKFLADANGKAEKESFYHGSCIGYQVRIRFAE